MLRAEAGPCLGMPPGCSVCYGGNVWNVALGFQDMGAERGVRGSVGEGVPRAGACPHGAKAAAGRARSRPGRRGSHRAPYSICPIGNGPQAECGSEALAPVVPRGGVHFSLANIHNTTTAPTMAVTVSPIQP